MVHSIDVNLRHTLFILKESPSTKKLVLPSYFPSAVVYSPDQILHAIDRALSQGLRLVIVVGEEDAVSTANLLKLRLQKEHAVCGLVVIAKNPVAYLKTAECPIPLLDVFSEKDLRKDFEFQLLRAFRHLLQNEMQQSQKIGPQTLARLNEIFIDMSAERSAEKLLAMILKHAIQLTEAQAGSLFMVEEEDGEMYFRLRLSCQDEKEIQFQKTSSRAMENSLCGYVALTGKAVNVPELSSLKPLQLPQFNRIHDHEQEGIGPILTLPMKNSRSECVAVIQLVNKKNAKDNLGKSFIPFDVEDESILNSLGTQAAICLENVDLYGDVQRLFEGFVRASITAIESRDPSTGGHSERVAKMSVGLARATSECDVGIYRSVRFKEEEIRELEYASLLHDFGKIGVREEVLVKAKKLYSFQLEAIQERIKICKAAAKIQCLEKRLKVGSQDLQWEREYQERAKQIDEYWQIVLAANEPNILHQSSMEALDKIRNEKLLLPDGAYINLISEEEYRALAITQGSLTESERMEIESHVRHTYQFLKMIPWTKDFKHLTEIAYCHHEKLDGTGYPRNLMAHEIPLQSKIMTIADIFDALTAADRWYKEAVPTERALDILGLEVAQGKIDPVLFEIFVARKIYEVTHPKILQVAG